jgi:RNA polymerase sigma-32 factor
LITANMRLVVKIAQDYRRGNHDVRDLIQEGNLGLTQAVARFDPDRGVKLCSYAAWWIRAYILKFVIDNWRLVKTGTTPAQRKLFFNLNKQQERLRRSGIEADTKQLAAALNVSEKDVASMVERFRAAETSLEQPKYSHDSEDRSKEDWLAISPALRPDVLVETAEFIHTVRSKIDIFGRTLQGRDLVIFRQRFVSDDAHSAADLAIGFGVSPERVRQLESRLKGRLRDYLRRQLGDAVPGKNIRHRSVSRLAGGAEDRSLAAAA